MGQAIAGRQHRLGQRISAIELRRTPGKLASGRLLLVRSLTEVVATAQAVAPGRQRHRERVGWRTFHRPFKQFKRHLFRCSFDREHTRQRSHCQLPGVELRGVLPPRPVDLGLTHRLLDRSGNTLRDPLLEFE